MILLVRKDKSPLEMIESLIADNPATVNQLPMETLVLQLILNEVLVHRRVAYLESFDCFIY